MDYGLTCREHGYLRAEQHVETAQCISLCETPLVPSCSRWRGQHDGSVTRHVSACSRRKQTMEMLAEGFAGKSEEVFGSGFSLAPAPTGPMTPVLAELRAKAERAQPKPTEKNQLYANFGRKLEDAPPPTPEQLAAAQSRREAAARHQEVISEIHMPSHP